MADRALCCQAVEVSIAPFYPAPGGFGVSEPSLLQGRVLTNLLDPPTPGPHGGVDRAGCGGQDTKGLPGPLGVQGVRASECCHPLVCDVGTDPASEKTFQIVFTKPA